jgi:hypothetical protein
VGTRRRPGRRGSALVQRRSSSRRTSCRTPGRGIFLTLVISSLSATLPTVASLTLSSFAGTRRRRHAHDRQAARALLAAESPSV